MVQILLMICILLLSGCATITNHSYDFSKDITKADLNNCGDRYVDDYLSLHTIFIDHNGKPLKYENGHFVDNFDFDTQIKRINANIENFFGSDDKPHKKILIYVHGGLNSLAESIKRSSQLVCKMSSPENEVRYYPILINWDSGPFSSFGDHFFFVRQGEERKVIGPLTFPIIALEDFGKIPITAPMSWYYQYFATDLKSARIPEQPFDSICPEKFRTMASTETNAVNALYCAANDLSHNKEAQDKNLAMHVSLEEADKSFYFGRDLLMPASYLLTAPTTKLALTPIVAGLGRPAWDIMVRRTTNMFAKPTEFDIRNKLSKDDSYNERHKLALSNLNTEPTGALAIFLQELNKKMDDYPKRETVLIGHSMGTIVLNNVIRYRKYIDNLNISDIVYMAAACSIRDFTTSVVPLLQEQEEECNPWASNLKKHKTNFYNLTLHPVNDANEAFKVDVLPRGSLLEWIDNFYTTPTNHIDRTLGKWRNIIQSLHSIPQDIRYRVTIKGFGYGDPALYGPQKHGQFDAFDIKLQRWNFWNDGFWKADTYFHK
ncbi:MAG: hypothetical protein NDI77_09130 [Geobacteraceae bacterium]|nr:hypothetical protein [Geobacteraceae bacterium]